MKQQPLTIVFVGQPNVGKTSLINKICGVHLKVGNFTGVTIEKAQANFTYKGIDLQIIDLPGTYSLNDYSFEEKITKQFLDTEHYDIIVNVVDSTALEKCLFLSTQLLELDKKMILALNMSDEARQENIHIDTQKLSNLLGIECISISALSGENLNALLDSIISLYQKPFKPHKRIYADFIESEISNITQFISSHNISLSPQLITQKAQQKISLSKFSLHNESGNRNLAIKLLQNDKDIKDSLKQTLSNELDSKLLEILSNSQQSLLSKSGESSLKAVFLNDTLSFAKNSANASSNIIKTSNKTRTQKIDSILLHKYLGIPIFLLSMWILFQLTFFLGEFPKVWIEDGFDYLKELVLSTFGDGFISSLFSQGIIAGVGAVLSFLPHILILFFGIVLLEGSGYMSRVAFLLDGFFHKFGLHGKSFIPLVTGFGCSVPAFMSARMLKNKNDRMLTLFIINFMSCGARLPVYTLFIGIFFESSNAGNVLFAIYLFGAFVGLCMAKLLKLTAFRGDDEPFVMEMPKYRLPSARLLIFSVWRRATSYIKKAGTFILLASIFIWLGTQYPRDYELMANYQANIESNELKIQSLESSLKSNLESGLDSSDLTLLIENLNTTNESLQNELSAKLVEQSFLGQIGSFIQPIFSPMEFDWRFCVALLNGLLAKETIISSMGVLYALGEDINEDNDTPLQEILRDSIDLPTAIAFLAFIMFYNPCFAASIVFGREAGGKRYILYLFIFTSIVSYIFALLGFYIARFFV